MKVSETRKRHGWLEGCPVHKVAKPRFWALLARFASWLLALAEDHYNYEAVKPLWWDSTL